MSESAPPLQVREFQQWMETLYGERDRKRGRDRTFGWFVEEVGELSASFRKGTPADVEHEFSDAFAWLLSLANLSGVDMAAAVERYRGSCPRCGESPCGCPFVA